MSNFEVSMPARQFSEQITQVNNVEAGVVKFWGVRGLIATPGSNTNRYGGNTSCVEISIGGKHLIFDGGTGLRMLGKSLPELSLPIDAHLFFTNSQSNRIQGFPFFTPAFIPGNCFHIYGAAAPHGAWIKQYLQEQMLQPHFPYPFQVMQSELKFNNLTCERVISLDDITITTSLINKTHCSLGYRIDWQGHSIAYVTDLQVGGELEEATSLGVSQTRLQKLSENADLLIANATYTYPDTQKNLSPLPQWQTAVDLAHSAGVKQLILSYHHPDDDDETLAQMQTEVESAFPQASLAYEGLSLVI